MYLLSIFPPPSAKNKSVRRVGSERKQKKGKKRKWKGNEKKEREEQRRGGTDKNNEGRQAEEAKRGKKERRNKGKRRAKSKILRRAQSHLACAMPQIVARGLLHSLVLDTFSFFPLWENTREAKGEKEGKGKRKERRAEHEGQRKERDQLRPLMKRKQKWTGTRRKKHFGLVWAENGGKYLKYSYSRGGQRGGGGGGGGVGQQSKKKK
jgi:hypothetical protein